MQETLDVTRAVSRRLEIRCNKTRLCIASVGGSVPKLKIAKVPKSSASRETSTVPNNRERVQQAAQVNPLSRALNGTLI